MAWKGKTFGVDISSDSSNTTIETVKVEQGATDLWAEFAISDVAGALDAFEVSVSPHSDASYHIVANASSDFTTDIQEPIRGSTLDPTVRAGIRTTATGMLWMGVKGLWGVRFKASADASDTTVNIKWQQR